MYRIEYGKIARKTLHKMPNNTRSRIVWHFMQRQLAMNEYTTTHTIREGISMKHTLVTIAASLLLSTSAWAGALTVPNTFTAGTPARAAQVNANSAAIAAIPAPDTANQVRDKFFAGTSCTNPNNPNDVMVKVGPLCVDKYEAAGTPDPGLGGNAATCNNFVGTAVVTGNAVACVSKWGVMDMVGNA